MCQGKPSVREILLALQQMQVLAAHLRQSTRQWHDHLERSDCASGKIHLQQAMDRALQLHQALVQAEQALAEPEAPGITVTPLSPQQG